MPLETNILNKIKKTQPLSKSAQQVLQISGEENHSLLDIVKVVECDNILTANILKLANSAAFQPKNTIDSIQMAISLLGERWVVSTALETCSKSFFNHPLEGYESEQGELWQHSLVTAIASRIICKHSINPMHSNTAFTAGILHDIGKAIISSSLIGTVNSIIASIDNKESKDYVSGENQLLATDHCEVGHALAVHWKLPLAYQDVILYHHQPDQAPEANRALTFAVHLGDVLSMMTGSGTGSDSLQYEINPGFTKYFRIDQTDIPTLMLEIDEEQEILKQSLNNLKS